MKPIDPQDLAEAVIAGEYVEDFADYPYDYSFRFANALIKANLRPFGVAYDVLYIGTPTGKPLLDYLKDDTASTGKKVFTILDTKSDTCSTIHNV